MVQTDEKDQVWNGWMRYRGNIKWTFTASTEQCTMENCGQ